MASATSLCPGLRLPPTVRVHDLGDGRLLLVDWRGGLEDALSSIYSEALSSGCGVLVDRSREGVTLRFAPIGRTGSRVGLALALLAATIASVYVSGLAVSDPARGPLWAPIAYLAGLLIPLAVHEMGHWVFMRAYRVPSSLPYFIPAPPLQLGFIGTFGAVINMRWLPLRRTQLAVIGIAGPLAGFIAALPVAYAGLHYSAIVEAKEAGAPLSLVPLVMLLLPLPREPGPGEVVVLSPLAFASYIVFLVTFLNLVPVAMLDGGHVARSLLGQRWHKAASMLLAAGILAASAYTGMLAGFALIIVLLLLLTGASHPGAAVEDDSGDIVLAIVALTYASLVVLTLPIPG